MKILVLDNYDSFTFNLVHIIKEIGNYTHLDIYRNDQIALEEVEKYDKILLSPGPGIPDSAGIMKEVIKQYAPNKSILGICLGHQGIAEVFGSKIYNMEEVLHGVPGKINIEIPEEPLFKNVEDAFTACHYHSWSVDPSSINGNLRITATDDRGLVMGISHIEFDVRGLQFHPESILTGEGKKILSNWLKN